MLSLPKVAVNPGLRIRARLPPAPKFMEPDAISRQTLPIPEMVEKLMETTAPD
jgi:hypothetical protein